MTSKFLGFFRKKSGNKENEHPTELDRAMSYRRSARSSSSKPSRRERSTRFASPEHEDYISPTAPYHTVTAPKLHKGPQSCPGGYREDFRHEDMNRSFETEIQTNRRDRREKHDNYREKYRRSNRDTSEYGSGDPSPIGNFARHPHYTSELLEDSDNDEYEYSVKMAQMEDACARFKSRLKHAEERHFYYKDQCKKLMRAKEETERAFLNQIETMKKENQKMNHRVKSMEQQMHQMRMAQAGMPFGSLSGQFGAPNGQFAPFPLSAPTNRLSMVPPMSSLQSNTTTPVTSSALGSINGAGEALTEASDVSCLQPPTMYDSSFGSRQAEGDEVDEMKNFRAEESSYFGMETPRTENSSSSLLKREQTPTLSDKPDVEGSTTSTVVEPREQIAERVNIRRSASDGMVRQHDIRHTTL